MGEIRFVGIGETSGYPYLVCKTGKDYIAHPIKTLNDAEWRKTKRQNNTTSLLSNTEVQNRHTKCSQLSISQKSKFVPN